MHKAIGKTHKGTEDIAALEIEELINGKTLSKENTVVVFETKDILDIPKLCYKTQSLFKVLYYLGEFAVHKELEATVSEIKKIKIDYNNWVKKDTIINVDCEREGAHDFRSVDISGALSSHIKSQTGNVVSLKEFDVTFYTYIYDNTGYLGIDFSGKDLSKRDYKIFITSSAFKGTAAYALLRIAEYNPKKSLMDPFCGVGIIPIEAALYGSKLSVNYYSKEKFAFKKLLPFEKTDFDSFFAKIDKEISTKNLKITVIDAQQKNIKFAEKNAKIAGVIKHLNFSRQDMEWLDTKMDKGSFDCIVSYPMQLSKDKDSKPIEKAYNELFYQAEYVLKKTGNITLLSMETDVLTKHANTHGFKVLHERELYFGRQKMKIISFGR
ncbi:MAG: THUMP domain-containing protein [archaeon]